MKKKIIILLGILIYLNLNSCLEKKSNKHLVNKQDKFNDINETKKWNNLAAFLAGTLIDEKSELNKFTKTKHYIYHKKYMNHFWNYVEKNTVEPIRKWRENNLPENEGKNPAFYPLSGADFINVNLFYPNSKDIYMVALEDPGEVPEFSQLNQRKIFFILRSIRRVIYLYKKKNYFTSVIMRKELMKKKYNGTTALLMIFLHRFNYNIHNVSKVKLNKLGNITTISQSDIEPHTGVQITYSKKNNLEKKTVTYFKMRLGDKLITENTPAKLFFDKFKQFNVFMKSAVYLLQMTQFQKTRDYFLEKTYQIVQDDSAIAYRNFNEKNWDVKLFGKYKPFPIPGCIYKPQKELFMAYKENRKPLPFQFGYGSIISKYKSNLMYAKRKNNISKLPSND